MSGKPGGIRNRCSATFIREIRELKASGYSVQHIADTTRCCRAYVEAIVFLLSNGIPSLIAEIENENFPHTIALQIARAKNPDVQTILARGYRAGTVNMKQIVAIRQRIERADREMAPPTRDTNAIIGVFFRETTRQWQLIEKAKLVKARLAVVDDGFRLLFADQHFIDLLANERIHTAPSWLGVQNSDSNEQSATVATQPSAEDQLDGKPITHSARIVLRRLNPERRAEAAEFMISSGNFSRWLALAILYATNPEDRDMRCTKLIRSLSPDKTAKLRREWQLLLREIKVTQGYRDNVLRLVVGSKFLARLIRSTAIEGYVRASYPDIFDRFKAIVDADSLDPKG